jgi:hypothetical protein
MKFGVLLTVSIEKYEVCSVLYFTVNKLGLGGKEHSG